MLDDWTSRNCCRSPSRSPPAHEERKAAAEKASPATTSASNASDRTAAAEPNGTLSAEASSLARYLLQRLPFLTLAVQCQLTSRPGSSAEALLFVSSMRSTC